MPKKSRAKYILDCICGRGCPCKFKDHYAHLNLIRNGIKDEATPPVKYINICGRREHEAIIKDASWCEELGLDQAYEVSVYLKRWGSWLRD